MSKPLVSVLMTAYNRENFIRDAIESVLLSTFLDFELIIVDDASKDRTVEIARLYEKTDIRVKVYVNSRNLGDYPNRNKAASYATGKYIKYLDSDDIMYQHCLQVMVAAMEKFPEAGFGLSSLSDPFQPYPVCLSPKESYLEHFGRYSHFDRAPGSSIIVRNIFLQAGGFNGMRMIGDNEFWFRLARYKNMVKFQPHLIWDREHVGQESKTDYAKQYDSMRKKIRVEALNHVDCPLSKTEIRNIYRSIRLKSIRNQISKWL